MNYSTDLWAPELHNVAEKWYVIFTADPSSDSPPPETDMFCDFSCPAVNHRLVDPDSMASRRLDLTGLGCMSWKVMDQILGLQNIPSRPSLILLINSPLMELILPTAVVCIISTVAGIDSMTGGHRIFASLRVLEQSLVVKFNQLTDW